MPPRRRDGVLPQVVAAHARAGVDEQHRLPTLRGGSDLGHVAPEERPRKRRGQQNQAQATQDQKADVLEPAALCHARRRRPQEHHRAERHPLARGPADQMKQNRPRDRERAQPEQWSQKTHVLPGGGAWCRCRTTLPRRPRLRRKSSSARSSGRVVSSRWHATPSFPQIRSNSS